MTLSPHSRWPLGFFLAFLAITFPLWCNAYLSPPDSASYVAVPRSIILKGDFEFSDDYEALDFEMYLVYVTRAGHLSMDWPMGSGVAWLPAYAVAHFAALALPGEQFAASGVSPVYKLFLVAWIALLGAGGLLLAARVAGEVASPGVVVAALFLVLLGTPVGFYFYMYGLMSHITSMAVVAALFWGWQRTRGERGELAWIALGVGAGVAAMIRPQNAAFLVVFVVEAADLMVRREFPARAWLRGVAVAAGGALVAFSPQAMLWGTLYGNPLQLPKIEEMRWLQPALLETLFSDYHGILSWSPLLVLVPIGIARLWRRDRVLAGAVAAAVGVQVYLNAANEIWWAGGSFGNRRMVDCGAFFVVAIAAALGGRWRWPALSFAVPAGLWNLLLMAKERAGELSLDHFVPWSSDGFVTGVLEMALPWRFFPAMMGDFAGFGWMARGLAIIAGVALAALLTSRRLAMSPLCKRRIITAVAVYFLLVPALVFVATQRTPPLHDEELIAALPKRNQSLFNGYYEYGFYCLQKGRKAEAIDAYRKAVELRPQFPNSYRYLASIHLELGDAEAALDYAGIALDLNPGYAMALGVEEAAIRKLLNANPSRAPYLLERLATRYDRAGRSDDARRLRERLR